MTPTSRLIFSRFGHASPRPHTERDDAQCEFENAIHECGHGVACVVLGVDCVISVVSDSDGLGRCRFAKSTPEREIVIAAAGPMAQGMCGYKLDDRCWDVDWHKILQCIGKIPEPKRQSTWLKCVNDCEAILTPRLPQIRGLALWLLDERELTNENIEEFLQLTEKRGSNEKLRRLVLVG